MKFIKIKIINYLFIIINSKYMNYTNIHNKKINLGIQILRVILCFWILAFHSLNSKKINYYLFYITKTIFFHVPCFSLISFYFSYNIFSQSNSIKAKKRLEKLLIPYTIWPLITFINNNILYNGRKIYFYQLIIQLLLGRQFIIPHWYLFSIIILTIFFFILSNLFKEHFLFISQLLMILIYFAEYTSNFQFLNIYKIYVKYPILDTFSIFPNCVAGLTIASLNLVENFKKNRIKVIIFSYLFLYSLFKYNFFVDLGGYRGILNNFASFFFFTIFYLIPLENINIHFQKIITHATSYTQGIYCLQSMMIPFVLNKLGNRGTFFGCIMIYFLSYLISLIGYKIVEKNRLKYLFI